MWCCLCDPTFCSFRRTAACDRRTQTDTGLSVFECFSFFSDFKKTWLFTFFEMTYQKVVKSHKQKFSPQYVTKEWSLRSMITVIQFLAPRSNCTYDFIHNRKRNRLTRPELVTLSTSIQTSNYCSPWINRKQTSSGNVGQCRILTAVKRNNKH